jgi:predicted RNA binding protein YcfA (HicA-like mRNA interferase family)
MKVREVIQKLTAAGWYYAGSEGSHHHYRHPDTAKKVTVPGKPGDDINIRTLVSIEKQAGIRLRSQD